MNQTTVVNLRTSRFSTAWNAICVVFDAAKRTYTVVGFLVGITAIASPYILDIVLEPEYDFIYAFERLPNPVAKEREQAESSLNIIADETIKNFHLANNEKQVKEYFHSIARKSIESNLNGEIDADQMRVWVLNVGRHSIENVTLAFMNCDGYAKYVANPIPQSISQSAVSNPEISDNGAIYHYGTLSQGSDVFVKMGFKNIGQCRVATNARRSDGKMAIGKWVTGDDYNKINAKLGNQHTRAVLNGTGIIVGLLLTFSFVWFGFAHRALRRQIAALESRLSP